MVTPTPHAAPPPLPFPLSARASRAHSRHASVQAAASSPAGSSSSAMTPLLPALAQGIAYAHQHAASPTMYGIADVIAHVPLPPDSADNESRESVPHSALASAASLPTTAYAPGTNSVAEMAASGEASSSSTSSASITHGGEGSTLLQHQQQQHGTPVHPWALIPHHPPASSSRAADDNPYQHHHHPASSSSAHGHQRGATVALPTPAPAPVPLNTYTPRSTNASAATPPRTGSHLTSPYHHADPVLDGIRTHLSSHPFSPRSIKRKSKARNPAPGSPFPTAYPLGYSPGYPPSAQLRPYSAIRGTVVPEVADDDEVDSDHSGAGPLAGDETAFRVVGVLPSASGTSNRVAIFLSPVGATAMPAATSAATAPVGTASISSSPGPYPYNSPPVSAATATGMSPVSAASPATGTISSLASPALSSVGPLPVVTAGRETLKEIDLTEFNTDRILGAQLHTLYFKVSDVPDRALENVRIACAWTHDESLTEFVDPADMLVVHGPKTLLQSDLVHGDWLGFPLDAPVEWNGRTNLVVELSKDETHASFSWPATGGLYFKSTTHIRTVAHKDNNDSSGQYPFTNWTKPARFRRVPMLAVGAACPSAYKLVAEVPLATFHGALVLAEVALDGVRFSKYGACSCTMIREPIAMSRVLTDLARLLPAPNRGADGEDESMVNAFHDNTSIENVTALLLAAEKFKVPSVRSFACDFVLWHFDQVSREPSFARDVLPRPDLVRELLLARRRGVAQHVGHLRPALAPGGGGVGAGVGGAPAMAGMMVGGAPARAAAGAAGTTAANDPTATAPGAHHGMVPAAAPHMAMTVAFPAGLFADLKTLLRAGALGIPDVQLDNNDSSGQYPFTNWTKPARFRRVPMLAVGAACPSAYKLVAEVPLATFHGALVLAEVALDGVRFSKYGACFVHHDPEPIAIGRVDGERVP
ncbi:hypothetical protein AMAG_19629 [Allomyces macrogynus ATCC 38327]|uniref:Uncharacterized protein n=1 Tax=Allomyces macrogynus (strain ATCC 38327) TaxID=578462 RepID=A0A0L0SY35_ALLM3|nr:hypothetical protein AMAG_19629 [Allomyces macrogynus ATCC 38327]|eukprot:KNE67417.1 hypothetical protein AMAG_19629 [Allomyces macrogynus ATCC 38327]